MKGSSPVSQSPEFVISRSFKAPRERVWRAWTDPAQMAQWFGPKGTTTTVLAFDLRPGGFSHWRMDSPGGAPLWGKAVYREVEPAARLVWVHSIADAEARVIRAPFPGAWPLAMLTTVLFEAEGSGEGTKITVRWVPINPTEEERATFEAGLPGMTMGWTGSFDQLDALLLATW
jgi:uncharacterized protein YndB with AHSA1/START domain